MSAASRCCRAEATARRSPRAFRLPSGSTARLMLALQIEQSLRQSVESANERGGRACGGNRRRIAVRPSRPPPWSVDPISRAHATKIRRTCRLLSLGIAVLGPEAIRDDHRHAARQPPTSRLSKGNAMACVAARARCARAAFPLWTHAVGQTCGWVSAGRLHGRPATSRAVEKCQERCRRVPQARIAARASQDDATLQPICAISAAAD